MAYIVAAVVLILGAWLIISTAAHLWRHDFGAGWYVVLGVLGLLGVALSLRYLADPGYAVCPHVRFVGFPIPVAIFVLEADQWTDFVPSPAGQHTILVADLVACGAIAMLPLAAASRLLTRAGRGRRGRNGKGNGKGRNRDAMA